MTEDINLTKLKTPSEFMIEIDILATEKRISYLDAVILYCEQNQIEIETAASLIRGSTKMKSKIQDDAEELNYLPKTRRLPI
jgi:Phage late-transcription coactivator